MILYLYLKDYAEVNYEKNKELCEKLFSILKDADGLDRVRLNYPKINVAMLRTIAAQKCVLFAFKMFTLFLKFSKHEML